jgi:hypothetical protein
MNTAAPTKVNVFNRSPVGLPSFGSAKPVCPNGAQPLLLSGKLFCIPGIAQSKIA